MSARSEPVTVGEIRVRWRGGCSICNRLPWPIGAGGFMCEHAAALTQSDVLRAWPGDPVRGPTIWRIYVMTCFQTGKQYVGQTYRTIAERWEQHIRDAIKLRKDWPLDVSIREFGVQAFSTEQIASSRTRGEANEMERTVIAQMNTVAPTGFNQTRGGGGLLGIKRSLEWRQGQSARLKKIASGQEWRREVKERMKATWASRSSSERREIILRGRRNRSGKVNDLQQAELILPESSE